MRAAAEAIIAGAIFRIDHPLRVGWSANCALIEVAKSAACVAIATKEYAGSRRSAAR